MPHDLHHGGLAGPTLPTLHSSATHQGFPTSKDINHIYSTFFSEVWYQGMICNQQLSDRPSENFMNSTTEKLQRYLKNTSPKV